MLIFFPVRAQIKLHKWPVATLLIAVVCLSIYFFQARSEVRIEKNVLNFCGTSLTGAERQAWARLQSLGSEAVCANAMYYLYMSGRADTALRDVESKLAREFGPEEALLITSDLRTSYQRFNLQAPGNLTARLWMERPSWNPLRMLTSSFAHGSWEHVIFNLIFFFAFGAAIELLLGPVLFLFTVVVISLFIGVTDTVAHLGQEVSYSLGLSGVVTGMLALFIYFLPRARIRFFFWILFSLGTVGVPGWFVGIWYIGGDMLRNLTQDQSHVNYIAHLSGAAAGFLLGITLFRGKRHWAEELVEEKVDLTQDESGLSKMNALLAAPGLLYIGMSVLFIATGTLIYFVHVFWLQLLMLLPAAVAVWQIHRMKRARRPDLERYQDACAKLEHREYPAAIREFEKLAERGYARAMLQLGTIHEAGRGVVKDLVKAVEWYTHAARRNNAEAQYRVGQMHNEGRGLRKDTEKTMEWWRRAAQGGYAPAAMSLAHAFEATVGAREVREAAKDEAVRWYHEAGRLFARQGRIDDVRMAIAAIRGLRPDHPLAQTLEAEVSGSLSAAARRRKPPADGVINRRGPPARPDVARSPR